MHFNTHIFLSYPKYFILYILKLYSQVVLVIKRKTLPAKARDVRDACLIPGLARPPGGGHGNPLQYSCLENPMDRGAWQATVHGVAKNQTGLEALSTQAHILQKDPPFSSDVKGTHETQKVTVPWSRVSRTLSSTQLKR